VNATELGRRLGILIALTGLIASCAKMGPPPGGPEDERGPQVEDVFPMSGATNVSEEIEIRVRFDEAVNRRSVEDAVFLSPDPGERVRFYWRGRLLRIRYLDLLITDRTYVITIGSSARDIRGNPVGEPFTLAFSTGDHIDQGRIIGQIAREETPQNLNLWAYSLCDTATPNPQKDIPEYRTQPNASGTFRFTYLKPDTYRVFAVFDAARDGFWNPSVDRIGIPSGDVVVTDESLPYLSFNISLFDTADVQIRGVSVKSDRQLVVKFSKQISPTVAFYLENFSGDTLSVYATYEDIEDSTHWQLFTARSLTEENWKLKTSLFDEVRATQTFLDTINVRTSPDTSRPEIIRRFPSSGERLIDAPSRLDFFFSEAVSLVDSIAEFEFYSQMSEDTFELQPEWKHPAHLSLTSEEPFQRGGMYTIAYNALALEDLSGNSLGDTLSSFRFQILSDDSLGSLSGTLRDEEEYEHVLSAFSLRRKEVVRTVSGVPSGEFVIEELPAGGYLIEVLRDVDGSGDFSRGSIDPWKYSEPIWTSRDTFVVRPRWDRAEIQLNFPVLQ
jgi:uncharacterized protein (DUF2141 family)